MKLKRTTSAVVTGTIGLVLLASLAGCGSLPKYYSDKIIPENNLIALKTGGPHENNWVTEDLLVSYLYTRNEDQLKISGTIDFADNLKAFNKLDYFDFWVYFTDSENKIIGHLLISPFTFFDQVEKTAFEKNYTLPAGANAMVFSYRGSASEGGSGGGDSLRDGGISWTFWKTPLG